MIRPWNSLFSAALLLVALCAPLSAHAQGRLHAFTFSAAALDAAGEDRQVRASLGLPVVGTFRAADVQLSAGFWHILAGRAHDSGTSAAPLPGELPAQFILEGNYPNPFNPHTTIRYALPEAATVRLAVYDMLGREVHLQVTQAQAAGWYDLTFDGGGLPSGLYLYRLEADEHSATGRMLLLK